MESGKWRVESGEQEVPKTRPSNLATRHSFGGYRCFAMRAVLLTLKQFATCTTGWAILLAAVGVTTCFLPWVRVSSSGLLYLEQPTGNAHDMAFRFHDPCWHGLAASGLFASLFLLLVVTFSTRRPSWWTTLLVFVAAVSVIVELSLTLSWAYRERPTTQTLTVQGEVRREEPINLYYTPQEGPYAALGCAAGLLFIAALQLRALLFARMKDEACC
jgi:hypothetical protein